MTRPPELSVLVIGAGGLGAPALLALAEAGVGRVTILEPDRVELSNLHRQIVYREADVGAPKAVAAQARLRARFPGLSVDARVGAFDVAHVELLSEHQLVLDGTDHFETKLAISDACVDRGIDYVFAGVVGFEGQVLAVSPGSTACLRCLFDEAPPPGAAPSCVEVGILGPIAGLVAAEQVRAGLELASGAPERRAAVTNRLWTYDGRANRVRTVPLRRMEDCRGCGSETHRRGATALLDAAPGEIDAPALDLTDLVCPNTYKEARKVLERLPAGGRVWIWLASDEAARNVPRSAVAAGHKLLAQRSDGRTHQLLFERGPTGEGA